MTTTTGVMGSTWVLGREFERRPWKTSFEEKGISSCREHDKTLPPGSPETVKNFSDNL